MRSSPATTDRAVPRRQNSNCRNRQLTNRQSWFRQPWRSSAISRPRTTDQSCSTAFSSRYPIRYGARARPTRHANRNARQQKRETKTMTDAHPLVSREAWLDARRQFLAKEKAFTRQRDALNAERRSTMGPRRQAVPVRHPNGQAVAGEPVSAIARSSLSTISMLGPDWQDPCPSCSYRADNFNGIPIHFALWLGSRARRRWPCHGRAKRGQRKTSAPIWRRASHAFGVLRQMPRIMPTQRSSTGSTASRPADSRLITTRATPRSR